MERIANLAASGSTVAALADEYDLTPAHVTIVIEAAAAVDAEAAEEVITARRGAFTEPARWRVIEAVADGEPLASVAKRAGVSLATIKRTVAEAKRVHSLTGGALYECLEPECGAAPPTAWCCAANHATHAVPGNRGVPRRQPGSAPPPGPEPIDPDAGLRRSLPAAEDAARGLMMRKGYSAAAAARIHPLLEERRLQEWADDMHAATPPRRGKLQGRMFVWACILPGCGASPPTTWCKEDLHPLHGDDDGHPYARPAAHFARAAGGTEPARCERHAHSDAPATLAPLDAPAGPEPAPDPLDASTAP